MMSICLWQGTVESGVSLSYIGNDVVLETNNSGKTIPHYFDDAGKAQEFIIRQAYALLSLGYEVYTG